MKKIFTIAAAMLFAASINAQSIRFEVAANDTTYGDATFSASFVNWNGSHSATSARNFGTVDSYSKLTGMIASKGAVDGNSRAFTINSLYAGQLDLYICSASNDEERNVTINGETQATLNQGASTDGKTGAVYKMLSFDINYGTTSITLSGGMYLYGIDFTSNGEEAPAERDTVAAYVQDILVGSVVAKTEGDASGVSLAYSTKYNANSTACTAITFTKSISVSSHVPGDYYAKITPAEGGFKAGDIITFQPFTVMSTNDYTGTSKYGNIRIYGGSDANVSQLYETASVADDKSDVTDGHEVAGDVKVHTYTLTADCDALYFGRTGNTRVNVLSFVVTRAKAVGPATAIDEVVSNTKAVKFMENGQLFIIRDGKVFNITGTRVK